MIKTVVLLMYLVVGLIGVGVIGIALETSEKWPWRIFLVLGVSSIFFYSLNGDNMTATIWVVGLTLAYLIHATVHIVKGEEP